jgi:hypothetical protein
MAWLRLRSVLTKSRPARVLQNWELGIRSEGLAGTSEMNCFSPRPNLSRNLPGLPGSITSASSLLSYAIPTPDSRFSHFKPLLAVLIYALIGRVRRAARQ